MKIGFDLDGIFINTPPLIPHSVISFLYRNNFSPSLSYRIPTDKAEIAFRLFTHRPFFRPPIKHNIEVLKQIDRNKNKLYLVTSRFNFLKAATDLLLNKYHLQSYFSQVHTNTNNEQPHLFKERILQKIDLDIYIDDDLDLLKYLSSRFPKTKFFWYDPKNLEKEVSGIQILHNLEDFKEFL